MRKWASSPIYYNGFLADRWVYCNWIEKEVGIPRIPEYTLHYTTEFLSVKWLQWTRVCCQAHRAYWRHCCTLLLYWTHQKDEESSWQTTSDYFIALDCMLCFSLPGHYVSAGPSLTTRGLYPMDAISLPEPSCGHILNWRIIVLFFFSGWQCVFVCYNFLSFLLLSIFCFLFLSLFSFFLSCIFMSMFVYCQC